MARKKNEELNSTRKMEEALIAAVRKRRVLYDAEDPDYIKAKLKTELWDDIAKEVDLTNGNEAKTVWKKLRNCYREALRRQRNLRKDGIPAEIIKEWRFQEEMSFLLPFLISPVSDVFLMDGSSEDQSSLLEEDTEICVEPEIENFESMLEENEEHDDMGSGICEENADESCSESGTSEPSSIQSNDPKANKSDLNTLSIKDPLQCENKAQDISQRGDQSEPISKPYQSEPISKPYQSEPIRKPYQSESISKPYQSEPISRPCQSEHISRSYQSEPPRMLQQVQGRNDSLYHFFMSMYETTRHMPPQLQHIVKNNVYNAVAEMEARLLNMGYKCS